MKRRDDSCTATHGFHNWQVYNEREVLDRVLRRPEDVRRVQIEAVRDGALLKALTQKRGDVSCALSDGHNLDPLGLITVED